MRPFHSTGRLPRRLRYKIVWASIKGALRPSGRVPLSSSRLAFSLEYTCLSPEEQLHSENRLVQKDGDKGLKIPIPFT